MIACLSIPYFAAAVERRADDALLPKPLAIGGQPWEPRPIFAFSHELARQGVEAGMSLRLVQVLSPQAHFMPAARPRYESAAGEVVDLLTTFTHQIEPEALWHPFADAGHRFTRYGRLLPARYCLHLDLPPKELLPLARQMGRAVRQETQFAPSIGLAANKFVAQIAATVSRPHHLLPVAEP